MPGRVACVFLDRRAVYHGANHETLTDYRRIAIRTRDRCRSGPSPRGSPLSFGDPHFFGQVVIGRPYYRPYHYRYHRFYHPAPLIIVREPRVVVVRPHGYYARRYHRHW